MSSWRSSPARSGGISLGAEVDAGGAVATYKDGILTVELPLEAAVAADPPCRSAGSESGE